MNPNSRLWHWIILIVLATVWGSSFILMKRGMLVYSPPQVAALRLFIAFLFLLPLSLPNLKILFSKKGIYLFLVGVLGNGIPAFLFTKAQNPAAPDALTSSLAGMLNSLTPLFTLILGVFLFNTRIRSVNALGIIIGLAGACGLIFANNGSDFGGSFGYSLLVVLATVLYAISVNVIKKYLYDVNSTHIAALAFSCAGSLAGIFLFTTDFVTVTATDPGAIRALGYISLLAIVGSALSVILFNMLIKWTNALFASSVTYLIPVVAIMWGWLDEEVISPLHLIWISVILGGVYLVNLRKEEAISLKS